MPFIVMILLVGCAGTVSPRFPQPSPREELVVWTDFARSLEEHPYPAEDIRPYLDDLREPMAGFLAQMRDKADWREWRAAPRIFRVADQAHFILPLTFDGHTARYCFSFVLEGGRWHFQHLEAITLPLDELGQLPLSEFPDLPEADKARIREEIEVSRDVRLFNTLAVLTDTATALDWFKDGHGYALAARAWIPFLSPSQAFVLYVSWEQSNLRGNRVVLDRLDPDTAALRLRTTYFQLYEDAAHLKQQISSHNYRRLFETRWRNRATAAGWDLDLTCDAEECTFRFSRAAGQ